MCRCGHLLQPLCLRPLPILLVQGYMHLLHFLHLHSRHVTQDSLASSCNIRGEGKGVYTRPTHANARRVAAQRNESMCHARQNSQERRLCEHAPQPCTFMHTRTSVPARTHTNTNRQIVSPRAPFSLYMYILPPPLGRPTWSPALDSASVPSHARPSASAQQTGRTKQRCRIKARCRIPLPSSVSVLLQSSVY